MLLLTAIVNLFTKPAATVSGIIFSGVLLLVFDISERRVHRRRGKKQGELDQFNLAQEAELTQANLAIRPGNILVPVSTDYALYGLESALRRVKRGEAQVVVLHVQVLRRGGSGEVDLEAHQLFSTIEQSLFTKVLAIAEKEGKPVRLAVAAANDLWEGILRTAANLQSSSVVVGRSSKMSRHLPTRLATSASHGSEMPDPRPQDYARNLHARRSEEQAFYLGPHSPRSLPQRKSTSCTGSGLR